MITVIILPQHPATHIVQITRESATVTKMTRCGPGSVVATSALLLESGDYLLLESGDKILLEAA